MSKKIVKVVIGILCVILVLSGIGTYFYFKVPKQYEKEAFINAAIYTVNEKEPWAESMVIDDNKIIFVGSNEEAKKYIDSETKINNVKGKVILPGFIDTHAHISMASGLYGIESMLTLDTSWDKQRILSETEKFIKANKDIEIIAGMGFNSTAFGEEGPTASELDEFEKERPVIIIDEGGHSAWVNSKAMEIGGINKDSPDPVPGVHYYVRDENGNPTGWLKEAKSFLPLFKELNIMTSKQAVVGAKKLFPFVSQYGITAVYDAGMMGFENELFEALSQMEKENKLPFRVVGSYMIQSPSAIPIAIESLNKLHGKYESDLITVDTMKFHNDGTLEAKTAAMFDGYGPEKNENGSVLLDTDTLNKLVLDTSKAGFNIHIHAVGDKAISDAIGAYEFLKKNDPNSSVRKTIAHVQFFDEDTVERLANLKDVTIQTTPGWLGAIDYTLEWVGKERYERQGLYNSLDKKGVRVSFGSDFPVGSLNGLNPIYNMYGGHTRRFVGDKTENVLPPSEEKLSIETLVKGYTINGAYQLNMQDEIGSLEVGKKADFIILKDNIFEQPSEEIPNTKILETYMNGDLVFERGFKTWLIEKFMKSSH